MTPEEIRKLLGGYATGTLTAEEQQALFAAALDDQDLFDALAREQSLRDLLRDPAARAELLSALDAPASRTAGFWQWVRTPMVAGLATAGVVAIAALAVWQSTRIATRKPAAPAMVAELRTQPVPMPPPAGIPRPARPPEARRRTLDAPPPTRLVDETAPAAVGPPPPAPPPAPGLQALSVRREADATTPAAAPPQVMARKAEALQETVPVDARALFYDNSLAPGANAFVPSGGGGAAAPRSVTGALPRLGVRVSILRATGEVDLTTVLDPGETVRLKLIPNADGFLYVGEGARLVASGAAQRLKPFETPELRFDGSGQKQLYVMLARQPQTPTPLSLGELARSNLVETSPGQERATYVVTGPREAGALQVVVPVTLTYR